MFADGTISEIYASHCFEHFPRPKQKPVLKEWCRVLKPGGKLYVSVPDFTQLLKIYEKGGFSTWFQHLVWGDQDYPLNYHYCGFVYATLAALLVDSGFEDVKRLAEMPYGLNDASRIRDNKDFIPISVSVEAVK